MKKLYFITGSQDLYGEETLARAAEDSKEMAAYLNEKLRSVSEVVFQPVVRNSAEALGVCTEASADPDCVGVIMWMHTFSPAKMWIGALKALSKPMLHLHTQYNKRLPYGSIDMDFMNLNQSAHGDREFGFICTRLGIKREVVSGYYKHDDVIEKIRRFAQAASAVDFGRGMRVAMFGSNMRDVAVTDGDRVESEIKYGWNVNYYGIGDLCDIISGLTDGEIDGKMSEYSEKYVINTENAAAVREQAKYEAAIERFIERENISAFTDTFQDLHGLNQLPGLAVQNIMAKGFGFAPEGDYKTAALTAVLCKMAEGRSGATGFLEDYTYDLPQNEEIELASHMLEVSPVFAADKPKIEVHPLGIGGKSDPARLVFDGITGEGIAVSMVDMGDRFRLVCAEITLVKQPQPMPELPVARVMWKLKPDFAVGAAAWIYAGGAHHAVVSTALTVEDIRLFAKMTGTELVVIDEKTELNAFEQQLDMLDALAKLRR
ncbi:L-arabinose isomerase [Ruminococcus sp. Marseille-P6503]|uniref:L-arabinose isomerase n=1 Tax=Ruminococcus sp. Marseille-P6503 TaxID=2364796 RepID=UPI000F51E92D|nr:L-arabinose isomerase [Ruminococcus sp. Marseille-P6503]